MRVIWECSQEEIFVFVTPPKEQFYVDNFSRVEIFSLLNLNKSSSFSLMVSSYLENQF